MKRFAILAMPLFLLGAAPPQLPAPDDPQRRITLSVRDADWKDVLRAALEQTDLNLSFDADLDTRVQGLDLKGVTLQELLDEILPGYNLAYVRNGRSLHIVKSDGGMRFYQVDSLSLRRQGSKDFSVNSSGQLIQTTGGSSGGSGQAGASSAYTSTLQSGGGSDPWHEIQVGLATLIFGEVPTASAHPQAASGGKGTTGPVPVSFQREGKLLIINPDSGVVTVAADPATHRKVGRYLAELQRRYCRQISIEARIVEVTLNNDSQIGVNWTALLSSGASSGGTGTNIAGTFTQGSVVNQTVQNTAGLMQLVVKNARVNATLSALASTGNLQVLSSPKILTLNNQKAILRVVREEAYFLSNSTTSGAGSLAGATTSVNITPLVVPVGIVLDIQPQISDTGGITLAVNPSVSEVVNVVTYGDPATAQANLPVVDRRDLDTVVHMQSGETLVLAGIIKNSTNNTNTGVPWLSRIPFLGDLFTKKEKSKSQTELAIFITATLVEDAQQVALERRNAEERLEKAGAELNPKPAKRPPWTTP